MGDAVSRTVEVRPGVYRDSVTLMQLSQALLDDRAVHHAQVSMGTDLNLDLLVAAGYDRPAAAAGDLVIAIDATDDDRPRIQALVEQLLSASTRAEGRGDRDQPPPRTVRSAVVAGGANVALISVPGQHAFRQAIEAIEAGAHPVVFSDNMTLDHERAMKERAEAAGLVAMGPDCGTVVLDGVGLGFANAVTPGPIALVSASGTGAQQVCAIVDHAGVGVRHVLGLGGRDLTDDVGGLAAFGALRLLDADPEVEVIGIVAKTVGPRTSERLDERRAAMATPTVVLPTGDLTAGAVDLLATLGVDAPELPRWDPPATVPPPTGTPPSRRPGRVLGLYSGGTLAAEAALLLHGGLDPRAEIIDLGDDRYTQGRPHPMIDPRLRVERLQAAGADDGVGAVLLDVVLGHGAHPDPASALAPAIAESPCPVVVALVGTSGDPQGRDAQAAALAAAGATVLLSNSAAVREAAARSTTSEGRRP